jgi:hypothetical protein
MVLPLSSLLFLSFLFPSAIYFHLAMSLVYREAWRGAQSPDSVSRGYVCTLIRFFFPSRQTRTISIQDYIRKLDLYPCSLVEAKGDSVRLESPNSH